MIFAIAIVETMITSTLVIFGVSWLVFFGYTMRKIASKAAQLRYAPDEVAEELFCELTSKGNTSTVIWLIRPAQAFIQLVCWLTNLSSTIFLTVNHAWYWYTQIDGETRKRFRHRKAFRKQNASH